MPTTQPSPLIRLRRLIAPDEMGYGWLPLAYLGYLLFLFVPMLMRTTEAMQSMPFHLGATLASIALFLPMYALFWRSRGGIRLALVLGIFMLALALFPFNPFANNYVIYAISLTALLALPLPLRIGLMLSMLAGFIIGMWLWGAPREWLVFVGAITAVIAVAIFFANHYQRERERKHAELKLSQDEVRRIAAFAERERIGRDLHDLLGHTLSMVALKADLAGKLAKRDAATAAEEMREVARIAREALNEVRSAVSGIRSAVLAAELASAKLLLETEGIEMLAMMDEIALPPEAESALAMSLREAATNVQRHARATRAEVSLRRDADTVVLHIADNGRGGAIRPGNGLDGMRARIESLQGDLDIESTPGHGTRVIARLPLVQPT